MTQSPKVIKIKIEESRELVDCLVLKQPNQKVDFKLLYGKVHIQEKTKKINPGNHLGWAKILSNNQFISYLVVKYNGQTPDSTSQPQTTQQNDDSDSDSDSDSDDSDEEKSKQVEKSNQSTPSPQNEEEHENNGIPREEFHELPHVLCTQFFKDIPLSTLIKTNNIKPPKPNADPETIKNHPRLPIVPSYIYAQKRLFVKWRYEITVWWTKQQEKLKSKADSGKFLTLLQLFHRAYPEFRSVQTGKQWFFQVMKQFQNDAKALAKTPQKGKVFTLQDRLKEYEKELKMATEHVRKPSEFVAPTQQRRVDQIRDEFQQRKALESSSTVKTQSVQTSMNDDDSSSSDDSDSSESDSDSDDDKSEQKVQLPKNIPQTALKSTQTQSTTQSSQKQQQIQSRKDSSSDDDSSSSDSSSESEPPIQSIKSTKSKSKQEVITSTNSTENDKKEKKRDFEPAGPTKRKAVIPSEDTNDEEATQPKKRQQLKKQRQ